jgi:alkaline phosphatase D
MRLPVFHVKTDTHNPSRQVNQTATFKFIVTSVPFTSLWTHDAQIDSWAAYPYEKASLLSALHTVPNVYLLSGDRHEFAAIEFNPLSETGTAAHVVREFSTSPLSMFYVPLIRTLRAASDAVVPKTWLRIVDGEENPIEEEEEVPMERVLKYLPIGNYKWCVYSCVDDVPRNLICTMCTFVGLRSRSTRVTPSIQNSTSK